MKAIIISFLTVVVIIRTGQQVCAQSGGQSSLYTDEVAKALVEYKGANYWGTINIKRKITDLYKTEAKMEINFDGSLVTFHLPVDSKTWVNQSMVLPGKGKIYKFLIKEIHHQCNVQKENSTDSFIQTFIPVETDDLPDEYKKAYTKEEMVFVKVEKKDQKPKYFVFTNTLAIQIKGFIWEKMNVSLRYPKLISGFDIEENSISINYKSGAKGAPRKELDDDLMRNFPFDKRIVDYSAGKITYSE